jgi:hypothetical protein
MKILLFKKCTLFGATMSAMMASSLTAQQTFDFNDSVQNATLTFVGNAQVRSTGGEDQGNPGDDGYAAITDAVNGQRGAIIFPDPTGGQPISGFTFRVDIRSGGGTNTPADGFSLNLVRPNDPLLANPIGSGYASAPPPDGGIDLPEEGSQTGLGIGLDEHLNGSGDVIGFSVRVDGVLVQQIPAGTFHGSNTDSSSLQTGPIGPLGEGDGNLLEWATFEAILANGNLTLNWKGTEIFTGAVNWFPSAAQIVFGGRTGGLNANHHIDNIFLDLTAANVISVSDVRTQRDFVEFDVADAAGSVLNPNTINVNINGTDVTAGVTVTKIGNITTVRHDQSPLFPYATVHQYSFSAEDTVGNDTARNSQFTFPLPLFPIEENLVGAEDKAIDEMWGVRYIFGAGIIDSFNAALTQIQNAANDPGNFVGTIVDVSEPVMNHGDGGAQRVITPDRPYHPDAVAAGLPVDDFIMYGVAYMNITEAGDYTIGTHSDDGFGIRVQGWNFTEINGAGALDPSSSDTFTHVANTGDSNTRAIATNVQPGVYRIEYFWWERAGGDNGEIYIAKGSFLTDAETTDWLAIGNQLPGGTFEVPGFTAVGADVISVGPGLTADPPDGGGVDGITTVGEAEQILANAAVTKTMTNHTSINFNDPQSGGPGRIPGDVAFPIDTAADDEDFAISFSGTLVVNKAGTYHIGFQGDDGGYLRIPGQAFSAIVENATNLGVIDEAGARIYCDCLTGNSSMVGEIFLSVGEYAIDGLFFERGGGAYFEVFGVEAGGTKQFLIETNGARSESLPPNGVGLVAGPNLRPARITDFTYDPLTTEVSITWDSKEGVTYGIFWSLDLGDDGFGESFTSDITDSIPSQGISTVYEFNENTEGLAPEIRRFYRIEETGFFTPAN